MLGPALTQAPLQLLQIALGALLLLFGMRWLRKAVLRAAGVIALHDEAATFAKEEAALRQLGGHGQGWDRIAVGTAYKITMIEGIEVVFIVVALGAAGGAFLAAASFGALAALLVVAALGLALHRPVSMIPENTLKFVVGVVLCGFGTFWIGEGIGLAWPGEDLALPVLVAAYLIVALLTIPLCRARAPA